MYGYYGRPPVGRYARPWVHQQYMHQQQMQQQRMNVMYPPPRAYHPSPYYDPYGYQAPMPMRPMTATERGFARRAALYSGAGAGMTVGMGAMAAGGGGGGGGGDCCDCDDCCDCNDCCDCCDDCCDCC